MRDGKRKWGFLAEEYDFSSLKRKEQPSVEKIVNICKMLESGKTIYQISKELCTERKIVSNIRNRITHLSISSDFNF